MELNRMNLGQKQILGVNDKSSEKTEKTTTEDNSSEKSPDVTKQINDLLMGVEKINGKLEIGTGAREAINERITDLSSRIGELNQMVMGREKKLDRNEVEFEKIRDAVHDIKPERIQKKFEEKEKEIAQINLSVEKINVNIQMLTKTLKAYQKLMQKIKSFENIFQLMQDTDHKLTEIKESKRYIDQKASKVEVLFTEINKKVKQIEHHDRKIEYLENLVQDLVKTVDKANVKLEHSVTKNDLEKEVNNMNKELSVLTDGLRELKHRPAKKVSETSNKEPTPDVLFVDKQDENTLRSFIKAFLDKKGSQKELYKQLLENGWKKEQIDFVLNN
ncbi:hypothetical protein K9M79_01920 [Candidatus Woesearchaeota archaeon]|nr:hypothetical protein [Candidatus Woesearchaeota archaeon]